MRRLVYPGSFDPVTNGHLDIVGRAPRARRGHSGRGGRGPLRQPVDRATSDQGRPARGEPALPEDPRDVAVDTLPLPDEKEDAMVSPISLRKFQEQLDRNCLDEIALLLLALSYGEMIELADAIWSAQPEGTAITKDSLPTLLHRWSKSR